jgi:hypothetical protein
MQDIGGGAVVVLPHGADQPDRLPLASRPNPALVSRFMLVTGPTFATSSWLITQAGPGRGGAAGHRVHKLAQAGGVKRLGEDRGPGRHLAGRAAAGNQHASPGKGRVRIGQSGNQIGPPLLT